MDQNALLTTARAEFMRGFVESMQRTIPRAIEDCFQKADETFSSLEQGRLLDARAVLVDQGAKIIEHMTLTMEQLLARSFKTTYSTYRPSANFNTDSLTLIDPTTFEGGLKLEEITNRFRREAEEQLRDLNIRIALIFEQEVTNERENPFRPYLFSKCISSSIEGQGLNPTVVDILIERLSHNFATFVPNIYLAVNNYLAKNGVAAQLQLKIRKSPTSHGGSVHPEETAVEEEGAPASQATVPDSPSVQASSPIRHRVSQIEQFFSSAMNRASNLMSRGSSVADGHAEIAPREMPVSPHPAQGFDPDQRILAPAGPIPEAPSGPFSWLKKGEAVGETLKKFFSQGSIAGGAPAPAGVETGLIGEHEVTTVRADGHTAVQASGSGHSLGSGGYAGANAEGLMSSSNGVDAAADGRMSETRGGPTLPQSLHRFQRSFTPSGSEMYDATGGLRNLILEQRRALNELTSNVDEQMTIDVVAMLFEFILRDTQVPAEIRAQLGRLQFLVLKVALKDNTLLTQKGHPARLLVNRIGSISLGLKQIDPTGAEITKEICRIVETLLQDESEDPQLLFSRMLDEFDAFIAKELRAIDKKTENAVEGAERARNRTLRFAHISAQIHEALLGLTIDPFLQHFFENVWVYALELADAEDSKRAHRYRLLIPDLLWSIVPKQNEDERMQLLALLPIILNTIKEGVKSINWDVAQQERLLNWLVDAHTKAMRINASATISKYPSLSSIHQHFEQFFVDPDLQDYAPLAQEEASGVKKFLDEAIQQLDAQVQMLDRVYEEQQPIEATNAVEAGGDNTVDLVLEQLKTGVSVEINLGGEPSQGKLNWVDPALTTLVLSLEGQEQPSMVSVRMFRRMIAHGRVKFLEAEPLFERAVQSLLRSADVSEPVKP